MDHADHVRLLRDGIPAPGGVWADIGAGTGAFTLALADLLGPGAEIHAVDRDHGALERNARSLASQFPGVRMHYQPADFAKALDLPPLDGLVMANALHFVKQQQPVVEALARHLKPAGCFLVVEYNIDRGNYAVPHPVPFEGWEELATTAGFVHTKLLHRRPSRFLREIYSAASW